MATYSISGTGTHAVSAGTTKLHATVTTLPSAYRAGKASPANLYDVGLLRFSESGFSYPAIPVDAVAVVVPVPTGVDTLAYALLGGAAVSVVEVIPVVTVLNSSLMPWDRNAALVNQQVTIQIAGGQADTTGWTYTVPTGRSLQVSKLAAYVERSVVPTTLGYVYTYIVVGGSNLVVALLSSGTVGASIRDEQDGSGLVLPAGTVVAAHYQDLDVGGQVWVHLGMTGTLFDA